MFLGSGSDHNEIKIYPRDETALVGSKKKFCCIVPERNKFQTFEYKNHALPTNYTPVNQTYIFELTLEPSVSSGDHLTCRATNAIPDTTVLFVGCKSFHYTMKAICLFFIQ